MVLKNNGLNIFCKMFKIIHNISAIFYILYLLNIIEMVIHIAIPIKYRFLINVERYFKTFILSCVYVY
jgi:hypothetical protein